MTPKFTLAEDRFRYLDRVLLYLIAVGFFYYTWIIQHYLSYNYYDPDKCEDMLYSLKIIPTLARLSSEIQPACASKPGSVIATTSSIHAGIW